MNLKKTIKNFIQFLEVLTILGVGAVIGAVLATKAYERCCDSSKLPVSCCGACSCAQCKCKLCNFK